MQKKSTSWVAIVLMLFLFFPIGIWMLVKKMTYEKLNYIKNGKSLKVLALILIGIAVMYVIMGITGEFKSEDSSSAIGNFIFAIVAFGGGGVFSLYKAQQYIKKGRKYNRYANIINSSNDTLIDNIAAAYPTTYEEAAKDIQSMIDDGYFVNAYVDLNHRELIFSPKSESVNAAEDQTAANVDSQPTSVICKNCGATNKIIPGAANECEYCGSPL